MDRSGLSIAETGSWALILRPVDFLFLLANDFLFHRSLLPERIVTSQQLVPDICGHSESFHVFDAGRDGDKGSDQLLLVFVGKKFIAEVFFVVGDPCGGDAAPDGDLIFGRGPMTS